jgi:hypothetical protein
MARKNVHQNNLNPQAINKELSTSGKKSVATNSLVAGLKTEHALVLQALEVANLAYKRVVNVSEISQALSNKEICHLEEAYPRNLNLTIRHILVLLTSRGLIFSPGVISRRRYYGSVHVLDQQNASLPQVQSRRRRVLELVRAVVAELGRAVRMGDVFEYTAEKPELNDLPPDLIKRSLLSLVETGQIIVIDSIRGDSKGVNLYLPCELDPALYTPTAPLTWMQEIEHAFEELWKERIESSRIQNRKPRPVSTGEIRNKINESSPGHPNLENSYDLINSLQHLAKTGKSILRKVKRPGLKAVLWAPDRVINNDLDIKDAYASDAERVSEAIQRAAHRFNRPVNIQDVRDEIKLDSSLELAGSSKLYEVLADVSKETVDASNGKGRVKRVTQHFYKAGKINGDSYYCVDNVAEARAFVRFHQLKSQWLMADTEGHLNGIEMCTLPSVAIGRAMLIQMEAKALLKELDNLLEGKRLDKTTHYEAEGLREHVGEIASSAQQWLISSAVAQTSLPADVDTRIPAWTAQELLRILKPVYPQAQKISSSAKLIALTYDVIRRIPNPKFKSRFSKDPFMAAEFLYDRTDALLYTAKKWGGHECCFQAMLASNELGHLRDPRFILPALTEKSYETRLAGIACLAFLWSDQGNKHLRYIAINDQDPGVRQSALWAYSFAGGQDTSKLLKSRGANDPNAHVREFSRRVIEASQVSWWLM